MRSSQILLASVFTLLSSPNGIARNQIRKRTVTTISFHGEILKEPLQQANSVSSTHCVHICVQHNECDASVFKAYNHKTGICILYDSFKQNDIEINSDENSEVTVYLQAPRSCKKVYETNLASQTGIYNLRGIGLHYCKMKPSRCSKRGWTLALKIDGNKDTFLYTSKYWTNESTYNEDKSLVDISSSEEGKFQAFMSLPFGKICLEMKQGANIRGIELSKQDDSLQILFKKDTYIKTYAGRQAWASLLSNSNLQWNCNKEGISTEAGTLRARLGIISNNEYDCATPDSIIGIGLQYGFCSGVVVSSGALANCYLSTPNKVATTSMLYIC